MRPPEIKEYPFFFSHSSLAQAYAIATGKWIVFVRLPTDYIEKANTAEKMVEFKRKFFNTVPWMKEPLETADILYPSDEAEGRGFWCGWASQAFGEGYVSVLCSSREQAWQIYSATIGDENCGSDEYSYRAYACIFGPEGFEEENT